MQKAFNVISAMSLSTQYDLTGHFIHFMAQPKLADKSLQVAISQFETAFGPIVVNYSLISPNQYDYSGGAEVFEYRTANSGPCSVRLAPAAEPGPLEALNALVVLVQNSSLSGETMSGMDIFYAKEWTIVKDYLTKFETFDQFQTRVFNVYRTLQNLLGAVSSSFKQASFGAHPTEFIEVVERGVTFFLRQFMQNYVYQLRINMVYSCQDKNYKVMPVLDFTPKKPLVPSYTMEKGLQQTGRNFYTDRTEYERALRRFSTFDLLYRYLRTVRESAQSTHNLYTNKKEWALKIAEYKAWHLTLGDRPTQEQMDFEAKQNISPIFANTKPFEKWENAETKYLTQGLVSEVDTDVFPGRYSLFDLQNGWSTFSDGAWSTLPNMVSSLSAPLDPSMSLPSI